MGDKTALFIGAHQDECEYGCGGMAFLLAQKGFKTVFVNVCCKSIIFNRFPGEAEHFAVYQDKTAMEKFERQEMLAAQILGAEKIIIGPRDNAIYFCGNAEVLELRTVIEKVRPDVAFIQWPQDNHTDHVEVSKASFKALSFASIGCEIYAYEAGTTQSMDYFYPDFYVDISGCMDKIDQSLMQFDQPTAKGPELVREKHAGSQFRGYISGFQYAEAYKILKFPNGLGVSPMMPSVLGKDFVWAGSDMYPWGSQYYYFGR